MSNTARTKKDFRIAQNRAFNRKSKMFLLRKSDRCGLCGKPITNMKDAVVDHIVPLSRGGSDTIQNMQVAHDWCDRAKGNTMPGDNMKRFESIGTFQVPGKGLVKTVKVPNPEKLSSVPDTPAVNETLLIDEIMYQVLAVELSMVLMSPSYQSELVGLVVHKVEVGTEDLP